MNTTKVILLLGLVYISFQQKQESTRNMMLIITGLLFFCMMGMNIEGLCTIPSDNYDGGDYVAGTPIDVNRLRCGIDGVDEPSPPLTLTAAAQFACGAVTDSPDHAISSEDIVECAAGGEGGITFTLEGDEITATPGGETGNTLNVTGSGCTLDGTNLACVDNAPTEETCEGSFLNFVAATGDDPAKCELNTCQKIYPTAADCSTTGSPMVKRPNGDQIIIDNTMTSEQKKEKCCVTSVEETEIRINENKSDPCNCGRAGAHPDNKYCVAWDGPDWSELPNGSYWVSKTDRTEVPDPSENKENIKTCKRSDALFDFAIDNYCYSPKSCPS